MAKTSYKQTIHGSKAEAASHQRQADLLGKLIKARNKGRKNLSKQLSNARVRNRDTRKGAVKDLLGQFASSKLGYDRSETDNDSNLDTSTGAAKLNRAREGTNALSELSNLQAGETDRIKGMSASIRGLKANLDSGVNDYATAITGINNSLGDLNTNITTNINNTLREQNQQDASAFGEFQAGQQQAYADLVDLYGQQGSAYEQAADALATKTSKSNSSGTKHIKSSQHDSTSYGKGGKKMIKGAKGSFKNSAKMANDLAGVMGKTFTEKTLTIDQMNAQESDPNGRFYAAEMKDNRSTPDELANAGTLRKMAAPEGSKLRKKDVA